MATAKRTQVKANKALDQAQATLNQIADDLKLIKARLGIEEPKSTGESPVDPTLLARATREASEKEAGDLDRAVVARKEAAAREAEDKARATREAKEALAKDLAKATREADKAEPKPNPPTKPEQGQRRR